jgi:NAD(P)H dehydrogenase (quinone)
MYAITGVTGNVGGAATRALLAGGQSVRAVVWNADKGQVWRNRGCEVALATIEDAASLSVAFERAEAVFVLIPPNFDPSPEFSEAREIGKALRSALAAACPRRVTYLSTIGAQAREMNLLTQYSIIEKAIGDLPISITFLRRLGLWRIAIGM